MKNTIISILVIVLAGVGLYFIIKNSPKVPEVAKVSDVTTSSTQGNEQASTTPVVQNMSESIIGKSVEGRDIVAYRYGTGDTELLFVGGIHGGYSWNTTLLAYQAMDYFSANVALIPANIKVTVIPVLNPDGLYKVVGKEGRFTAADVPSSQTLQTAGRFNANAVDLSRNFDCDWKTNAKWQNTPVSGGSAVFSEPESLAVKSYVETQKPKAVVVWYSAAGGVYASNCHNGVSSETNNITKEFASASGYPAHESFDFYATTGDMVNWLAKINVPAISVLLTNHTDTEWTKNQKGIEALLKYYTK